MLVIAGLAVFMGLARAVPALALTLLLFTITIIPPLAYTRFMADRWRARGLELTIQVRAAYFLGFLALWVIIALWLWVLLVALAYILFHGAGMMTHP